MYNDIKNIGNESSHVGNLAYYFGKGFHCIREVEIVFLHCNPRWYHVQCLKKGIRKLSLYLGIIVEIGPHTAQAGLEIIM